MERTDVLEAIGKTFASRFLRRTSSDPLTIPSGVVRPRHMDVQSKLEDVHRQFPDHKLNILFVFLPSLGEPRDYLVQALLGQNNFRREEKDVVLEKDGLFAKKKCYWGRATVSN